MVKNVTTFQIIKNKLCNFGKTGDFNMQKNVTEKLAN